MHRNLTKQNIHKIDLNMTSLAKQQRLKDIHGNCKTWHLSENIWQKYPHFHRQQILRHRAKLLKLTSSLEKQVPRLLYHTSFQDTYKTPFVDPSIVPKKNRLHKTNHPKGNEEGFWQGYGRHNLRDNQAKGIPKTKLFCIDKIQVNLLSKSFSNQSVLEKQTTFLFAAWVPRRSLSMPFSHEASEKSDFRNYLQ